MVRLTEPEAMDCFICQILPEPKTSGLN